MTAEQVIHKEVMELSEGKPALNGCKCPRCSSEDTYDVKWDNYYFGCMQCKQVVAIWIESDISDKTEQPWFLIPKSN